MAGVLLQPAPQAVAVEGMATNEALLEVGDLLDADRAGGLLEGLLGGGCGDG